MTDMLEEIWGNKVVTGEIKPEKPEIIAFRHSDKAIDMLNKYIKSRCNIVIHCDVDVDGIGSGYEIGRFISCQSSSNITYVINKEKEHGIQQKHVDFFENRPIDLLIIVYSSYGSYTQLPMPPILRV